MNQYDQQFQLSEGLDVISSDGNKVGEVTEISRGYVVVQQGFFFPDNSYIPAHAIASVDDKVHLNVSKEEAMNQDPSWDQPPTGTSTSEATEEPAGGMEHDPEPFDHDQDSQRTHVNEDDDLRIDVSEEELVARRREVDLGSVDINKRVVSEEREMDVPVTEEHVEVTRHAVDRDVAPGEDAFTECTLEVPVHGEEVDVEKQTRVVEEIDVDKQAVQDTERVSGTVRHDEVTIDGDEVPTGDEAPAGGRKNTRPSR